MRLAVRLFGKVNVDFIALLAIQVLYAIASLALISVGLTICRHDAGHQSRTWSSLRNAPAFCG
jgi:hypothetical protein